MSEGIDYFGRGSSLTAIQERLSVAARHRMFALWKRFAGPVEGKKVLDVGATPDRERRDSNCMVPWFHECGARVTLYSPEDVRAVAVEFPFADLLPSAGFGAPIPAPARAFAWAAASAVLEHVGGAPDQVRFIADCARVADGLFLTTPNRWHWLEFHTKLPLLHWLPRSAHRRILRALGRELWASEAHLRLVGAEELRRMARAALGGRFWFRVRTVWALGMPSNLVLLASRTSSIDGRSA